MFKCAKRRHRETLRRQIKSFLNIGHHLPVFFHHRFRDNHILVIHNGVHFLVGCIKSLNRRFHSIVNRLHRLQRTHMQTTKREKHRIRSFVIRQPRRNRLWRNLLAVRRNPCRQTRQDLFAVFLVDEFRDSGIKRTDRGTKTDSTGGFLDTLTASSYGNGQQIKSGRQQSKHDIQADVLSTSNDPKTRRQHTPLGKKSSGPFGIDRLAKIGSVATTFEQNSGPA
mmetsp:Transcript_44275/g.73219  ORF Transcript_44275/g.73219 Transcript_44275/m.73219 type:complete len:224 (-) Transcript_44275:304-975(-)